MDAHFREAPYRKNAPVLMGLLDIWNNDFLGAKSRVVAPYDEYLSKFPAFLSQLEMESLGKRINSRGEVVDYSTGTAIWGAAGTDAQHSFFQLLHQGSSVIPADFIAPAISHNEIGEHHKILLSNFFAQTEALAFGRTEEEAKKELEESGLSDVEIEKLLPHKTFPGSRPTNSILIKKITPYSLGALIAAYEHKVFVQGAIWDVNAFDQWGVELGKKLAKSVLPSLSEREPTKNRDSSTNGLINKFKEWSRKRD